MKKQKVLFLCTGNYYRSRFAEVLFNRLAEAAGLGWVADSRGLRITAGRNVGPMAKCAVEGLRQRGIVLPGEIRMPKQVREEDLRSSALIIALKEKEHRPMVAELFGPRAEQVEYWQVHDLDLCEAEQAMGEIERGVRELVARLQARQGEAA